MEPATIVVEVDSKGYVSTMTSIVWEADYSTVRVVKKRLTDEGLS